MPGNESRSGVQQSVKVSRTTVLTYPRDLLLSLSESPSGVRIVVCVNTNLKKFSKHY